MARSSREPAELAGWRYTRQTYKPAAHFTDEVTVESFTFASEQPGDRAIVAWLASHLPRGTMDDDVRRMRRRARCPRSAPTGSSSETLTPAMVSRAFLAVEENSGTYCGGAHPNYYTVDHTFDRQTGEEIDLFDWIGEPRIDGEDSTLRRALRALVVARWPADAEAECREMAEDTEYWSLGLAREGLVFRPDFPHVATACEEPVTVEWRRADAVPRRRGPGGAGAVARGVTSEETGDRIDKEARRQANPSQTLATAIPGALLAPGLSVILRG